MIIGLHVPASGGVEKAPGRAGAEGGEALQIFAGSPRMWRKTTYTPEQGEAFQKVMEEHGQRQSFVHVMYLTSYGTPDEEHRAKSVDALKNALTNCDTLGCVGAVTHLGSHKGLGFEQAVPRLADSFKQVLDENHSSYIILENSAGSGGNICNSLEELATVIDACDGHERVKVCIDTAHALTSGYEIRTAPGWSDFMDEFDRKIGLDRLAVLHLNDSKADLGSRVDRHENIGDGYFGKDGFAHIINDPRLSGIAGILEVPGIDGSGPDRENVERLKELQNA